ncbi:phosphoglycerate kinase [Candidatus Wolfebacteria bacterium]|nr:phosphoglycerate kinase [Candidatus Wolfebacteria bacterium]
MKFLTDLSKEKIFGRTCLLRVDLNIAEKEAKNSPRILGILPTIKFLIKNGAKVVILSHRGRPQKISSIKYQVLSYTLKSFAKILSKALNQKIKFIDNFNFQKIKEEINKSKTENIYLLENLRFLSGEEKNDKKLAKQLANLGDFYVNDAFAASHRVNASVSAITKFLPSYAGFLMEKEIKNLSFVMDPPHKFMWGVKNPRRRRGSLKAAKKPFVIILGGAKISDKIGLIENFQKKADYFLIGGGIAHNFLLAQGLPIGDSIFEEKTIGFAKKMLKNKKIILPVDYAIKNRKILDIGPNTMKLYSDIIRKAKTIIWNGPMGYFEDKRFAKGSEAIIKAILKNKAFSVVGGGETATLFSLKPKTYNLKPNIFVSTGGGAMLEYLAGKKLPGIKALK